jgi:hypothetical protein
MEGRSGAFAESFMSSILALLLLANPQSACEAARAQGAEFQKDADAWAARHRTDCPLCASGSRCREGYERADEVRRRLNDWRRTHVDCGVCGLVRCGAGDSVQSSWMAEAGSRHRERCRGCALDPLACEGWRTVLEQLRMRLEEWRVDHPGQCERCGPSCDEWRRRAAEIQSKTDEVLKRHKERCADCLKGAACDRAALLRNESQRERLTAWKRHVMDCSCTRRTKRP